MVAAICIYCDGEKENQFMNRVFRTGFTSQEEMEFPLGICLACSEQLTHTEDEETYSDEKVQRE